MSLSIPGEDWVASSSAGKEQDGRRREQWVSCSVPGRQSAGAEQGAVQVTLYLPYQNRDRVGEDRIICSGKVQQSFIKQSMIDSKGKGSECHYFCASMHTCSVNYLCDDMSSQYGWWNRGKEF